ncbi:MAG: leucine-rich repeat domain-containing protein, partial [Aristaeellaceae bacterium]
DCDALTSITLPDGLTSIGDYAFYDCDALTSITLPDGLTSIGDYAFYDCDALTSITLPDGLTSIGKYAFAGWYKPTLTVPRDSYAAEYAKENNLPYTYTDSMDWLNG